MRLKRRKVILLAGSLIVVWMIIVLFTPPPMSSESSRRPIRQEVSQIKHAKLKMSYATGGKEGKQNYGKLEDVDFDDFQPDGARNNSLKNESGPEKHLSNSTSPITSAFLDMEKDLVPRNRSVGETNPGALWAVAASWVTSKQIYPESVPQLGDVLHGLSTVPIVKADVGYRGTQLKARFELEGGQMVVFKPKRFARDHVIYGTPYAGYDRHNGEIAAFHLDRVLGLRRAPLVAGRTVSLKTEIQPVATRLLLDTFLTKDNNTCFYGKCYYCKPAEPACADGDIMEGSVTLWLPTDWPLKQWHHLWARTYKKDKKAKWEVDQTYCTDVLQKHPIEKFPTVLDMVDAAIFDFLIGNADRHRYETFQKDEDHGMLLLLDNAKSFGNSHHDEKSILAPLYQCCRLRQSLWAKLQSLQNGILSNVMRQVLSHDPIAPVLNDKHLQAMDRRLEYIITVVHICFKEQGAVNVLI